LSATKTALVLDFGGPVLLTPFELAECTERRLGLPPGSLPWRGPFDPGADEQWRDVASGALSERRYWANRATEFGALTGQPADIRTMIRAMYAGSEDALVRPGARALMTEARAAGLPVGILTNDLGAFHTQSWIDALTVLRLADAVVDGSHLGILKPDRRIYLLMSSKLGVEPADAVFLDDQPVNLAGGAAVGMMAVAVDVTDPDAAFAQARALLGLPPRHEMADPEHR
jgi:putative hydrolase of the HAD superfamily